MLLSCFFFFSPLLFFLCLYSPQRCNLFPEICPLSCPPFCPTVSLHLSFFLVSSSFVLVGFAPPIPPPPHLVDHRLQNVPSPTFLPPFLLNLQTFSFSYLPKTLLRYLHLQIPLLFSSLDSPLIISCLFSLSPLFSVFLVSLNVLFYSSLTLHSHLSTPSSFSTFCSPYLPNPLISLHPTSPLLQLFLPKTLFSSPHPILSLTPLPPFPSIFRHPAVSTGLHRSSTMIISRCPPSLRAPTQM